ncbi:MAG: hypothetical protein VX428_07700 [Verrucomicrobiota bacterium]|nr:hypothetical protein [Verrucomicrobiota bacterium]
MRELAVSVSVRILEPSPDMAPVDLAFAPEVLSACTLFIII